jgi:release factor glutamine methyltransferase
MHPDDLVATLRAAGSVFAEDEARILIDNARDESELEQWTIERVDGAPLEQIVGWAEFCGLRIVVAPGVFVPRQRTSAVVRRAAYGLRSGDVVVDLCCGTGAIGAALADAVPGIEVYAADSDPAAVECARRNLPADHVFEGDLYDALPTTVAGRIRAVVANAPYVPTDAIATMPPEARDHEHRVALDGGPDGLDVQRDVIAGAPAWLATGGRLLVETSRAQASRTRQLMQDAGLAAEIWTDDDVDGTVVTGTRLETTEP